MQWNNHSNLRGRHAILAPSNVSWPNYDDAKMIETYNGILAKEQGTIIHDWAAQTIKLGYKQPRKDDTICMYINDAIKLGLDVEQPLYYTDESFGTSDAIQFDGKTLIVHDLKTGVKVKGHMDQLISYAALFCLEYGIDPMRIKFELRIYQFDEIVEYKPEGDVIKNRMDIIVHLVNVIQTIKLGAI